MSAHVLIATVMRPDGDTGVQTHFRAYAAYLAEYAKPAQLITPFDAPKWLVYPVFALRRLLDLINSGASVWWYRTWHAVFLRISLRRVLADDRACVVYAQCPLSADAALRARLYEKQRVVMVVHFNISQADEWADKGKISVGGSLFQSIKRFESVVLPRLDGLVFVSEFMRRELLMRIPAIKKIPYRVIPNFIRDPGECRKNDFLLKDLICIGTLEPRKNQRYAIEIVAAAKQMGRPISLTIVGNGPSRSALEALCQKLDVTNQVKFTGFVKNGSCLFSQHRACLHVAQIENFPLTLVEALSYGKPIFARGVGGVPEVFRNNEQGRFIPLDDANSAARLIIAWLDSEAIMRVAGIAARTRYLDLFEEVYVAKKLTEFLKN
jgi:glycosyltransferase involved in cell wall biosynthesis